MSNTHRGRVIVVEPGAVATVLPGHITHEATKGGIAEIITFALGRPHSVSLNEILVRPTAQAG